MLSTVSLAAIGVYQRRISPRKGFVCAYRVEHGDDTGCSGYAKRRIQEVGVLRALPDIRARLKGCREAAEERRRRREERKASGEKGKGDSWSDCCGDGGAHCAASSLPKRGASGKCDGCDGCDGCGPDGCL